MKHEHNKFYSIFLTVVRFSVCFTITFGVFQPIYTQTELNDTTRNLLILHTNDIHDHLRVDYDGVGGLPFISGFVRDVRALRNDVIVLDAGDVAEKGDLVARKTKSELTFEALARIGYNAWAPGNHDYDFGIEALRKFTDLAGMDIVCINLLKEDGSLEFEPSKIYKINGLRVGVIGAIEPRDQPHLNLEETAMAIARESQRLKPETDIILALVHISAHNSSYISEIAPDIDIFISGHSHEEIREAIVVPKTGALIVQAGYYANYVGSLDLTIDIRNRKILSYDYQLGEMNHLKIAPDLEMIEWVRQKELDMVPEAQKIVSWSPRVLNHFEVGYLAAEALRKATESDIAFNHTARTIRSHLPAGILDLNAIYRTGGEYGKQLITIELKGSEIHSYLQGLQMGKWMQTQWSGFHAIVNEEIIKSDLDMDKKYRVVMPKREWERRFLNLLSWLDRNPQNWPGVSVPERPLNPILLEITWTDAMVYLLTDWNQKGIGVVEGLKTIIQETGQVKHLLLSDN